MVDRVDDGGGGEEGTSTMSEIALGGDEARNEKGVEARK